MSMLGKYSILIATLALLLAAPAQAANAWYYGVVKRVAMSGSDGTFVVTFASTDLDDCLHKYAYFRVSQRGLDWVKMAHAMAITSLTSGKQLGVVIDKAAIAPGDTCDVTGMMDLKI